MDALRITALEKEIDGLLRERREDIVKEITRGCEEADSEQLIYAHMLVNAISFSIKVSTGLILDMLIEHGIVQPHDEEQLRKNILSVVK